MTLRWRTRRTRGKLRKRTSAASHDAYLRCEATRLAGMSATQLAAEGDRLRWGLLGEERVRIYARAARRAERAGCEHLGGLGAGALYRIAGAINGR